MIYFIEAPYRFQKAIKIGYTDSFETLETRLAALQSGNPSHLALLAVCPGSMEDEKQLHYDHSEDRLSGEWFLASKAVRRTVRRARYADWHDVEAPKNAKSPDQQAEAKRFVVARGA